MAVDGTPVRKVDRLVEQLGRCGRSSTPLGVEEARGRFGEVLERLRGTLPNLRELLEAAEEALLAFYHFPAAHWSKRHFR